MINRTSRKAGIVSGLLAAVLNFVPSCTSGHFKTNIDSDRVGEFTNAWLRDGYRGEKRVEAGAASSPGPSQPVSNGNLEETFSILTDLATGKSTRYPGDISVQRWMHDAEKYPKGVIMKVYIPQYGWGEYRWWPGLSE